MGWGGGIPLLILRICFPVRYKEKVGQINSATRETNLDRIYIVNAKKTKKHTHTTPPPNKNNEIYMYLNYISFVRILKFPSKCHVTCRFSVLPKY